MSTTLHPATPDMSRDEAAAILEKNKIHHAIVNNIEGKFAGLFSSWDIARECALDAKVRFIPLRVLPPNNLLSLFSFSFFPSRELVLSPPTPPPSFAVLHWVVTEQMII